MSAQHVEVVRAIHAAFRRDEYEAALEFIDGEIEFLGSEDISAGQDGWHGHDGIRNGFASYLEAWDDYRLEDRDVIDCGDQVLVEAWQHGRFGTSKIEVSGPLYLLWTIRGEKAVKMKTFRDRDKAREAAGLPR